MDTRKVSDVPFSVTALRVAIRIVLRPFALSLLKGRSPIKCGSTVRQAHGLERFLNQKRKSLA